MKEYDEANPSRDPSFEPKTKVVTLTVRVEVPDEGDDQDTMREAKQDLINVFKHAKTMEVCDWGNADVEATEIEDA